jgi:hypothetical protein
LPRKNKAFAAFPHVCHDLFGRHVEGHTRDIQRRFGGCRGFDYEDAAILAANPNLHALGSLLEERREPLPSLRISVDCHGFTSMTRTLERFAEVTKPASKLIKGAAYF